MDTITARRFYNKYGPSVAYTGIEVTNQNISIATAYHIGDVVFITARHVVDVFKIRKIATTKNPCSNNEDESSTIVGSASELNIIKGPFLHPKEDVDIDCFIVDKKDIPAVPLGSHFDDWISDDLELHSVPVIGYPPIPLSENPALIVTKAETNAVIDKYVERHPHFIFSCMSGGGFSGGVPLNEYGFSMGIIAESLVRDYQPSELGYLSVISLEPINIMLDYHNIMPMNLFSLWY
jgi:hypothetical protein